jgi:aspartyl aminopeptidase
LRNRVVQYCGSGEDEETWATSEWEGGTRIAIVAAAGRRRAIECGSAAYGMESARLLPSAATGEARPSCPPP